jgi:hypothetical protein
LIYRFLLGKRILNPIQFMFLLVKYSLTQGKLVFSLGHELML